MKAWSDADARQVRNPPHVQPNGSKRGHTYRGMRGKVGWGILGYGFIGIKLILLSKIAKNIF